MKRLILFSCMILGASAFGINITNYPATNAFDGSMTFLLSKASAATNFNIQADLIASTNWAIATFDPSGAASSATNGYPWTNIVVQEAVHATNADNVTSATYVTTSPLTNHVNIVNVDTPGQIATNLNSPSFTFSGPVTLSSTATNVTLYSTGKHTFPVMTTNSQIAAGPIEIQGYAINNNWFGDNIYYDGAAFRVRGAGYAAQNYFQNGGWEVRTISTSQSAGANVGSLQYRNIRANIDGSTTFGIPISVTGTTNMYGVVIIRTNGNIELQGTLTATNGVNLMVKPSFTTNFTCTTNLQVYLCNGTNQIVTLPNAAYVPNSIYRFTSTNGYGSYTLTNATGAQTIRDGTSLSHKQIGVAPIALFSDGAHWWLAAKDQEVNPNAQFSCSTNIPLTLANAAYPVTFNTIDFNNSQGIALALGTNGTHFSKMWITNSGQYEFTPSIVIGMGNVSHTVRYWFRSNDTNIPASTTPTKVAGNDVVVVTVPFVVNITTPTAIEIWAESDGVNDALTASAASGNYPASPSVICPVKRISDTWP